jgi:NAD(P)-dependent dehydrogenase (short-subunit alcohol dehydrogenase family)
MLPGRIAIVTGASCGIGAATSCALSRAGASVVLASDDCHAISTLAAAITSCGGHAVAVPTDLTSPVSVRRVIEQTLGAFGRLDIAFNCTGFNNVADSAVSVAMEYQIPPMARARAGHIVNLALTPAVVELTRAAASDFAQSGVRVHATADGTPEEVARAVVRLCSDEVGQAKQFETAALIVGPGQT